MDFSQVKNYVVFMRYKRSGSALLSCLLDAHPNIVFPRCELLWSNSDKWERDRIFDHLYTTAKRFQTRTFAQNGYKYKIEGMGKVNIPLVMGHKSATRIFLPITKEGNTTLQRFEEKTLVPFKYIHLVRNPFNMVSARWKQKEFRRKNAPLDSIIDHLEETVQANHKLYTKVIIDASFPELIYYIIHLEELIKDPAGNMRLLCDFLEVPINKEHLFACKNAVFEADDIYTDQTPWTKDNIERVNKIIKDYPEFFRGYTYG